MTYTEQEQEALRLIKKYGPAWMLKDQEAIGEIIGVGINVRLLYNSELGKFSTYLIKSVKNKIYQLQNKKTRNHIIPIDENIVAPYISNGELLDYVLSAPFLTDKEKSSIYRYYYGKETMKSIGEDMDVSREMISQYISNGINKLKRKQYVLVEK